VDAATPGNPAVSLALVGVTEVGDRVQAWLTDTATGEREIAGPGESAFGFAVKRIGSDSVILSRGGREYSLRLGQKQIPIARTAAAAPAPPADGSSAAAPRQRRRAARSGPVFLPQSYLESIGSVQDAIPPEENSISPQRDGDDRFSGLAPGAAGVPEDPRLTEDQGPYWNPYLGSAGSPGTWYPDMTGGYPVYPGYPGYPAYSGYPGYPLYPGDAAGYPGGAPAPDVDTGAAPWMTPYGGAGYYPSGVTPYPGGPVYPTFTRYRTPPLGWQRGGPGFPGVMPLPDNPQTSRRQGGQFMGGYTPGGAPGLSGNPQALRRRGATNRDMFAPAR